MLQHMVDRLQRSPGGHIKLLDGLELERAKI